ncbi:GNAT family N-acyltransferase [Streptosporangium sp. NPDC006007]|uniref:GNAT family N-acetyltransferase n=1 Tax=Streptosporangium sp. NPDC006007 TaxID=3154575 RepID=UPI0033B9D604
MSVFTVPANTPGYSVSLAQDGADVWDALRLRHLVFTGELGARLDSPIPGIDIDEHDPRCEHLIVRENATGLAVGTYRLLPPDGGERLHSDSLFDLSRLADLRGSMVEIGRLCVHPDHRDGTVVKLLWSGVTRYMRDSGHDWLAGGCSVPLDDGGRRAAAAWNRVRRDHLAPAEHRVVPITAWDACPVPPSGPAPLPSLLRGYLRLGARVCGPPAYDAALRSADFFMLLSMDEMDSRHRHPLLGATA